MAPALEKIWDVEEWIRKESCHSLFPAERPRVALGATEQGGGGAASGAVLSLQRPPPSPRRPCFPKEGSPQGLRDWLPQVLLRLEERPGRQHFVNSL